MSRPLFGCIEAGGTKFVLALACEDRTIVSRERVETSFPADTLSAVVDYFRTASAQFGPIAAFGVASFGPLDVDPGSPTWGRITRTPKPGWSDTDLVGPLRSAFGCPVGFDTDVNGAILAESVWGAARGLDVATYITVGTGIGGGAIVNGALVHGDRHPEMGHLLVRIHPADADFKGICRFHGNCLEGLASGPAIEARWRMNLSQLPANHPGHRVIAYYLAQFVIAQQALLSPRRIIMGGGVAATPGLLTKVRADAAMLAKDYFGDLSYETLLVAPTLGDNAGLLGALALARQALR